MSGHPILFARNCAIILVAESQDKNADCVTLSQRARNLAELIGVPWLDYHDAFAEHFPLFIDHQITDTFEPLQRSTLIISGGLLESAVTQTAIFALMDGYDVFVCADLVETDDPANTHLFYTRIQTCGGNIVTYHQIVREFMSQERNVNKRRALSTLLS